MYEAIQESLGRHVALKLLPHEVMANPRRLERFRWEADTRGAAPSHRTSCRCSAPAMPTAGIITPCSISRATRSAPSSMSSAASGISRVGASRPGGRDDGGDRPDDGDLRPTVRCRERGATPTPAGLRARTRRRHHLPSRRRRFRARSRTMGGPTGSPLRGSVPRLPMRWRTPTSRGCCTAISSPPTCCWI